jgi:hypothetical protein
MLSTSVTIPIQVTFEQLVTHLSTEQLWSLQELIRQRLQPPPSPLSLLEDSGLVGCGEAEEDLSENYQTVLTESWSAKHDYR